MGARYRLHRHDLPGKPDIVFGRQRKAIFVHGCFWHGHACKPGDRPPKENAAYWTAKIARNRQRDELNREALGAQRWTVLTVWECELADPAALRDRLAKFLS